jgi:type II secretory pathway pseudopilin PulG
MKIENAKRVASAVNLRKQRGASLLEGIAYLGIAALVVLGAVSLLTSASASAKANQTTEQLISLRTAVKKLYAGQSYPTGTTTDLLATLISARAVPSTLTVSGTTATNSWGGAVTVNGTTAGTFTIVYVGVPKDVCINTLSGMTGWTSVGRTGGTAITTSPLTSADATSICSADPSDLAFIAN